MKKLALLLAFVLALVLTFPTPTRASDPCGDLLSNIATLTLEAYDLMDVLDALETAIAAPDWNPASDGWMVDAHEWAEDDLIGTMNQVASWQDYYRTLQCM